jgi:hypothetical protein
VAFLVAPFMSSKVSLRVGTGISNPVLVRCVGLPSLVRGLGFLGIVPLVYQP